MQASKLQTTIRKPEKKCHSIGGFKVQLSRLDKRLAKSEPRGSSWAPQRSKTFSLVPINLIADAGGILRRPLPVDCRAVEAAFL